MIRNLCLLLSGLCLLASCRTDTVDPERVIQGHDYYPLEVGNYYTYQVVDSRQLGTEILRDSFQVREYIDSIFTDLQQEPIYRIIRYRRLNATEMWAEDSVMMVKRTSNRLERLENNLLQVKLVFPVRPNLSWDANVLNAREPETYRYREVEVPYTLNRPTGDTLFANTLRVMQADFTSAIDADIRWERYAKGVGMIEKHRFTELLAEDPATGQFVRLQANTWEMKLIQHGRR